MTLNDEIQTARRTHNIHDIIGTNKKSLVCPLPMHIHVNNTPSFSVFWWDGVQMFRCHGNCGLQGDVIDLVGFMRIPGYQPHNKADIGRALKLLDDRYEKVALPPVRRERLRGDAWMDFLPPGVEVIEYAKTRGLDRATLQKFHVGQSGHWMTIPAFEEGRLVGIKLRNLEDGLRYMALKGSHQALFNYDAVYLTAGPVLLVKGEIPCMLLDQLGFQACAPTGGEGGWRENWRVALALANVIVVGDNDETGRVMAEKRAGFLHGVVKYPPPRFKDVDAWILADPSAVEEIRRWTDE
jgi:hypothetical protein